MPGTDSPTRFGTVARGLHWLTALLILTAIPLGLCANSLPYVSSDALATKAQVFSLHKTVGVAAFIVAVVRIVWALTQSRPAPLHPERQVEVAVADLVHWMLYISLLAVPLSGWVHHAATTRFAPILWPFGQNLPLVQKIPSVEHIAATAHGLFTKLLIASILLHIAGALKHHLIDRDATLQRMVSGVVAPDIPKAAHHGIAPMLAALAIYAAGAGLAIALTGPNRPPLKLPPPRQPPAPGKLLKAPCPSLSARWGQMCRAVSRPGPPTSRSTTRPVGAMSPFPSTPPA